jgi:hypothetical protein
MLTRLSSEIPMHISLLYHQIRGWLIGANPQKFGVCGYCCIRGSAGEVAPWSFVGTRFFASVIPATRRDWYNSEHGMTEIVWNDILLHQNSAASNSCVYPPDLRFHQPCRQGLLLLAGAIRAAGGRCGMRRASSRQLASPADCW